MNIQIDLFQLLQTCVMLLTISISFFALRGHFKKSKQDEREEGVKQKEFDDMKCALAAHHKDQEDLKGRLDGMNSKLLRLEVLFDSMIKKIDDVCAKLDRHVEKE
jgi:hypothetical protein